MKSSLLFLALLIQTFVIAQNKVAIIGGGIAGVATAHYINQLDSTARITVFEKNAEIGGNAHTIAVPTFSSDTVWVDAGPQYFADKSWENYIALLKEYGEYNENEVYPFKGSIVLQQDGKKRSNLVTPYKGNFRGEKLSTLIDFKKVFDWGYAIFSKENKNYPPTIGEWVNAMPFDNDFKTNTLIPFLAADLGTSTEEIKQTSTAEMVKLFAFRKATSSAIFKIMKIGMGTLVQHIGEKLKQSKGVIFKTSSPVKQLSVIAKGYNLVFENVAGTQTQHFDYVIIATHPDQAAKILQSDNQFSNLVSVLKEFPYFKAHIVLHRYDEIVDKKYPSFFNIHIDPQTKMVSNTMNLGIIHPRYKGIYKSWVSDEVYSKIKAEKLMIHEEIFYHPLITPAFISNIATLKERLKQFSNLYISGGWSQGLETQETAILSGKEAAEHYFQWQKTTRQ